MKRIWKKSLAMSRFCKTSLALIAAIATGGVAHGQSDWSQPSEIGSYQSILSQAGYGSGTTGAPLPPQTGYGSATTGAPLPQAGFGSGTTAAPMPGQTGYGSGTTGAPLPQAGYGSGTTGALPQQPMLQQASPPPPTGFNGALPSAPMATGSGCVGCATGAQPNFGAAPVATSGAIPFSGGHIGSGPISAGGQSIYSGVVGGVSPVLSAPVYSSPVVANTNVFRSRPKNNYTLGLFGLAWERDYEDSRRLATNNRGDALRTTDADHGTLDGYGINLGVRKHNGSGFEAIYWAFNTGSTKGLTNQPTTDIRGFQDLLHAPTGVDVATIYTDSLSQTVVRDTDINNLELNLLRNGGQFCTKRGRTGFYELFGGVRWFQFDEQLQYLSESDTAAFPQYPEDFAYTLAAENTLVGLQAGGRSEICLTNRVRLFGSVKGGVFNNDIETHQDLVDSFNDPVQINGGPALGRAFDVGDSKDDIAFLGEVDLGVLLHVSNRTRFRIGYRALGVAGVALADDQIPHDFLDAEALGNANSNGSLLLGGAYYGIETSF